MHHWIITPRKKMQLLIIFDITNENEPVCWFVCVCVCCRSKKQTSQYKPAKFGTSTLSLLKLLQLWFIGSSARMLHTSREVSVHLPKWLYYKKMRWGFISHADKKAVGYGYTNSEKVVMLLVSKAADCNGRSAQRLYSQMYLFRRTSAHSMLASPPILWQWLFPYGHT